MVCGVEKAKIRLTQILVQGLQEAYRNPVRKHFDRVELVAEFSTSFVPATKSTRCKHKSKSQT
jgi:hypothetical protein